MYNFVACTTAVLMSFKKCPQNMFASQLTAQKTLEYFWHFFSLKDHNMSSVTVLVLFKHKPCTVGLWYLKRQITLMQSQTDELLKAMAAERNTCVLNL